MPTVSTKKNLAHGQDDLLGVLAALNGIDLHLLGGQAQGTEERA